MLFILQNFRYPRPLSEPPSPAASLHGDSDVESFDDEEESPNNPDMIGIQEKLSQVNLK